MADPLSVAATIAGLVGVADTLFRTVIKFSRDVKSAIGDITSLANAIRDLSGTLHSLSLLASSLETDTPDPVFRLHHVNSCRESVLAVKTQLSKQVETLDGPKTPKSVVPRLLWPYTSGETQTLVNDTSRHKTTMAMALSVDSMKAMFQCLSNQSEIDRKVPETHTQVREVKEITINITMNEHRQKVLDSFLVVNPQRYFEISRQLRHPLTGGLANR